MKSVKKIFSLGKTAKFSWRYFKAKKSTNAIHFIAWTCITAIFVGSCSLILLLSVFNGFEGFLKTLYSSLYTDLRISAAQGKMMTINAEQYQKIQALSEIKNASKTIEEKALLQNGSFQSILNLRGVDDNYRYVTALDKYIYTGKYDVGTAELPKIILGAGIENAVGMQGEYSIYPLVVYLPKKTKIEVSNPMTSISVDTISKSGVFYIQQEFDNHYGFTNIGFVQRMLNIPSDKFSSIDIILKNPNETEQVQEKIQSLLGNNYKVQTRYQQNESLYKVMRSERWFIYAILSFILVVAAFTMIGAITMLVLEKQKDIEILQTFGASNWFIQKIFLGEGILLAAIGGIGGMALAALLVVLQIQFKLVKLGGVSFLIDYFPVELKLIDFVQVSITIFVISVAAAWLPSRKAAMQKISLRSE